MERSKKAVKWCKVLLRNFLTEWSGSEHQSQAETPGVTIRRRSVWLGADRPRRSIVSSPVFFFKGFFEVALVGIVCLSCEAMWLQSDAWLSFDWLYWFFYLNI
jgi:hypothetical protein